MRGLLAVLGLCLAMVTQAAAMETVIVTVTGAAVEAGPSDRDSARRRALYDAILAAALAGGAEVRGHTVMDKSVITADLTIVRPVGRVLDHRVLEERHLGDEWRVTIEARVGDGADGQCRSQRNLQVTAFPARISVSPNAPAWTAPLAQEVANTLVERLDRHRATDLVRVTQRAFSTQPVDPMDYETLTRGALRLGQGDHGFLSEITVTAGTDGRRDVIEMDLRLQLVSGAGEHREQIIHRTVPAPEYLVLGRAASLAKAPRRKLADQLTRGIDSSFDALLDRVTCEGVLAHLSVSRGSLLAPVGRKQGLTRGSLAFTADRDASVQMLEVVGLDANSVRLRPLDPSQPAASFAGRSVRFVETGL